MEGAYTFTCQLCRARLTLVGNLEAAESAVWAGGRGFLVPPHLQASVFDHTNVDESFIVLDGKRQGLPIGGPQLHPHANLPPGPLQPPQQPGPQHSPLPPSQQQQQQQQPLQTQGASPPPPQQQQPQGPQPPTALHPHPHPHQPQLHPQQPQNQRGLDESFVVLGAASVLRPTPGSLPHHHHHHLPPGASPLHLQALHQQQQLLQLQQAGGPGPGQAGAAAAAAPPPPPPPQHPSPPQQQQPIAGQSPPSQGAPALQPHQQQQRQSLSPPAQPQTSYPPPHPTYPASPPQPSPLGGPRRGGGASTAAATGGPPGGGGGGGAGGAQPGSVDSEVGYGSPLGAGGGGGAAGSGLDSKLQALAQLFELASTNTQVDHPLCMDCVGQLKEEMETQIAEAEREIAAYSACLMQLEGAGAGRQQQQQQPPSGAAPAGRSEPPPPSTAAGGSGSGSGGLPPRDADTDAGAAAEEEVQLEELSRLEQKRDQERARAEVLEAELAVVVSELASLSAASADLDSLEERYWHDVADFELLLRAHTDERGALLAKIDRAGQRLQLLKNTSVLYDAFKIWHDGPFGTISGFRLGRTPEVAVEWDEINAAWGQAVLLLHTMAQMSKLQFSQHRLLPMGSHPRVADKRASYDLFGPVSKLWSANYDRAMVAYLACLKEFGEHARKRDVADGKPIPFNFPFPIDGDKVNNHTIKLTLNKDVRWTKALKFMLANLKIALQWSVKQDQGQEAPQLAQLGQEGPQTLPEH